MSFATFDLVRLHKAAVSLLNGSRQPSGKFLLYIDAFAEKKSVYYECAVRVFYENTTNYESFWIGSSDGGIQKFKSLQDILSWLDSVYVLVAEVDIEMRGVTSLRSLYVGNVRQRTKQEWLDLAAGLNKIIAKHNVSINYLVARGAVANGASVVLQQQYASVVHKRDSLLMMANYYNQRAA